MDNKRKFVNKTNGKEVKVMLLGGAEEVGINGTVIESGNDIVIVDMGFGFPGTEMYGVDYLIPDITYLKNNKHKIKGLVITHGHLDHIGAIPYVIEDLGFPPIISQEFTLELLKLKLEEFGLLQKCKLKTVKTKDVVQLGGVKVSFFGVNHNVPQSMGVAVHTKDGVIAHTGDYKLDDTPVNEPVAEYGKICDLGEQGVLLAMCDSTNSMKSGRSVSESDVTEILEDIIKNARGRVIAATFASLVTRINQIITIGIKYNRKIAVSGMGLRLTIEIAKKLGYITAAEKHFIDPKAANDLDDKQVLFLTTGSQGEDMAALARIARKEHRDISIKKGDTVILSSSVIPGNALAIQKLIDELIIQGADVIHQAVMDVHAGGHAHKNDQKLMINMLKPRFFMPIEGPQAFLKEHAKTAMSVGIKEKNIIIPRNGQVYKFDGSKFVEGQRHEGEPILVSGKGIGDIGELVLKDRDRLANNGMVVLGIDLNTRGTLDEPIQIVSRGFVYVKDSKVLIDKIIQVTEEVIKDKSLENRKFDKEYTQDLKEQIVRKVGKFVRAETDRDPMILPVFV